MNTLFQSAVVRIHAANGRVAGGGFLLSERLVLTCAHVVAATLNLPEEIREAPQAPVCLDFPLVAPGYAFQAKVVHWRPQSDVAGLELEGAPPPGVHPAHLIAADDLWGHPFGAFGFPAGHEDGVWASGVLRGSTAAGWLQIEDVKEAGYRVEPGFSGAPVWDEVLGSVVGIIVAAERKAETKAAFVIPAQALLAAWPALAEIHLDAQIEALRIRRDQADQERRARRERRRVVNLRPLDVTHTFKDRVREVRALCDHLTDSSVRLVSVVGRGGMGKTALVSRVLGDLEQGVLPLPGEEKGLPIDGILYLSVRSTGLGLERIYADVGRMLGEPAASKLDARWADGSVPLTAKVEYLLEAMRDGMYLILLDNLESVTAEDGTIEEGLHLFIERCLTRPGGVRLIVTSREQVKIAADALHSARNIPLREGLPDDEAVALLHDLDPQGTLGLRDAPEEDLRRAARLTQSIPRALEILAGILHEDPRASLPRLLADEGLFGEQVVEQLVAAGYSRLGEAERRVIEALAVFDRPVEETAVAYLLHPWWPGLDVRARLHRLVRGYFVSVNRVTGRYSLHPLDREYSYRQIPDAVDEDKEPDSCNRRNLELRAADFYASIRKPKSEWKAIDDLEPQLAEFEHRVHAEDYDGACRVVESIGLDLYFWGHYARLIEMQEKLLGHLTDPRLRATNLGHLGNAYRVLGRMERATGALEEALSMAREIGDRRNETIILGNLGNAYGELGQIKRAIKLYEEALAITREIGDRSAEEIHLGRLGVAYRSLGQMKRGIEMHEQALDITRDIGDRRREYYQLSCLGSAYHDLGQVRRAIKIYKLDLTTAQEINNRRGEAAVLGKLGRAYSGLGKIRQAIEFYRQALVIARETGDRRRESYCLLGLSKAVLATRKLAEAQQHCEEALALEVPETSFQAAIALGIALLHQRDRAASETFASAAARCRTMLDKTDDLYEARYALAADLVGQAVCDPRWANEGKRAELLAPALAEYRRALEITAAPGVVQDAIRDLELIQAAGIEGLEPVFELLESAEYQPDLPEDLSDIPEEVA
jgi:tetratricopeptide (TPR) repeat protein